MSEHKSRASYGSVNLVVAALEGFLQIYVDKFRPLVKKGSENKLFPSAKVCNGYVQSIRSSRVQPYNDEEGYGLRSIQ